MNFITGVGQKLGEGGRGTHSHWPVYAIRLTVDPFSASFFLYWMPLFFTTSYTQWPPIVAFSVKIFQRNQKCVKLPGFCAISCQITPFFWICHLLSQMTHPLFARKLSLMVPRFDASVWASLSLSYVSAPPRVKNCVPKQHESLKFDHMGLTSNHHWEYLPSLCLNIPTY